jgi:hypothetical protein
LLLADTPPAGRAAAAETARYVSKPIRELVPVANCHI